MRPSLGYRTLGALLGALLLIGCGSLLGGGKRDDLFRFGVVERPDAPFAQYPVRRRTLTLLRSRFAPEIEGDRILTTRGESALYIKDARWVASVPDLFAQTLERQFGTHAPGIRLAAPRNAAGASRALQVTIDRFEAHYRVKGDQKAPPTVIILGDATLFGLDDPAAGCVPSVLGRGTGHREQRQRDCNGVRSSSDPLCGTGRRLDGPNLGRRSHGCQFSERSEQ